MGITDHAQKAFGELVYVSLPSKEHTVAKGDVVAVVESVKSASDVFAPLTGTIVETNRAVLADPALVNSDPLNGGWLFKLRIAVPSELESFLTEDQYEATLR